MILRVHACLKFSSFREAKKKQKNIWMDLVQLIWNPPPPHPP